MKILLLFFGAFAIVCGAFANSEAERFYAEYLELKAAREDAPKCRAKLNAALTLAPTNETYRHEELQWLYRCKNLDEVRAAIQATEKFERDFPDTRRWVWGDNKLNHSFCMDMSDEAEALRVLIRNALSRQNRRLMNINPDEIFKSPSDIQKYQHYLDSILRNYYYLGARDPKFIRDKKNLYLDFVKRVNAYLIANPNDVDAVEKINPSFDIALFVIDQNIPCKMFSQEENEKFLTDYYLSLNDFIEKTENSPLPCFQFIALHLKTIQKITIEGIAEDQNRQIYFEYFAELDKQFPGFTDGKRGTFSAWAYIHDFLRYGALFYWSRSRLNKDDNWGNKLLAEYLQKRDYGQSVASIAPLFVAARQNGDESAVMELIKHAEVIRQNGLKFLTDRNLAYNFSNLINHFYSNNSKISRNLRSELLRAVNSDFDFIEIPVHRIMATVQFGKDIYLMCHDQDRKNLELFKLDCENNQLTKNSDFPVGDFNIARYPAFCEGNIRSLVINHNYAAFAIEDVLAIGKRNDNEIEWRTVADLPPDLSISAMALLADRLFVLSSRGLSESNKEKMLLSMDMDGKNRKIHFATNRIEALNPIDAQKNGSVSGLYPKDDAILFFTFFSDHATAVWSFSILDEKFSCVAKIPASSTRYARFEDNTLWSSINSWGESIYKVDLSSAGIEHFFYSRGNIPDGTTPQYKIPDTIDISGPILVQNNKLYLGDWMPFCVDLKNPEKTKILAIPKSFEIFRYENKIFFIGLDHIYVFGNKR